MGFCGDGIHGAPERSRPGLHSGKLLRCALASLGDRSSASQIRQSSMRRSYLRSRPLLQCQGKSRSIFRNQPLEAGVPCRCRDRSPPAFGRCGYPLVKFQIVSGVGIIRRVPVALAAGVGTRADLDCRGCRFLRTGSTRSLAEFHRPDEDRGFSPPPRSPKLDIEAAGRIRSARVGRLTLYQRDPGYVRYHCSDHVVL